MAIKKKQGDSLWVDITGEGLDTVDADWEHWAGSWAIVPALGEAPVLSGSMTKADTIGKFRVRVGASLMQTMAVGSYILVCEVSNASVDYRQEVTHEKLAIEAQGIVA